jgi:predicted dehydrogenase
LPPLRLGLLSTAGINRALLGTRDDCDAVEIVAVGSRDAARSRAYADEFSIPRAHGSYEALLADPELDAVYVALPNVLHHEWAMRALAAGKHVLCEKPLGLVPELWEDAFAAADRAGLVLLEAGMWRHHPQTALLGELLPQIGELQALRATFMFTLDRDPDVRLVPELGGGSLLDVGWYCVSGLRLLAGREPDRVYGERVEGPTGVDLRFTGVLRFGETTGEFTSGFAGRHAGLEAIGARGTISVPDPWLVNAPGIVLNGDRIAVDAVSSYRLELENLAAAVAGTAQPLLDAQESVAQVRVLAALARSAATGQPVVL